MRTFIFEHNLTKEVIAITAENRNKAILKMVERVGASEFNTFWHIGGEQG